MIVSKRQKLETKQGITPGVRHGRRCKLIPKTEVIAWEMLRGAIIGHIWCARCTEVFFNEHMNA